MIKRTLPIATLVYVFAILPSVAGPAQDKVLQHYQSQAEMPVSVARGKALFEKHHGTGKPKMPSCTTCHGLTPTDIGKTRVGKEIAPMALSLTIDRYSDLKKLKKWFRRNCKGVIGRECTAQEKGDFLAFMMSM